MVLPSIISLILLLITNLPNEIQAQSFKSAYFEIIQKDKSLLTSSSNLIKLFQSDQASCLLACNLNFLCNVVIFNSNGLCALCQIESLNELIDSTNTTVFINENPISRIKNGLINYWSIVNDLRDYIGSSDMSPGSLDAGESIGFTRDRFNTINGAIYMNPGYYTIPPGVYFNNSFTFLVWVKAFKFAPWTRIIDFGNGIQNNIVVSLSYLYNYTVYISIYRGYNVVNMAEAANKLPKNTWFHLATVYDGRNLMMYVNGSLVANSTSDGPTGLLRTNCYIGRSNWHYGNGDSDAYACYDDLMIYNRALSLDEVQNCMNTSFN